MTSQTTCLSVVVFLVFFTPCFVLNYIIPVMLSDTKFPALLKLGAQMLHANRLTHDFVLSRFSFIKKFLILNGTANNIVNFLKI